MVKPLNNSIKAENKTDKNGQQLFHVVLKVVGNTREEKGRERKNKHKKTKNILKKE